MNHSLIVGSEEYIPINKDIIRLYKFEGIEFYVKNSQIKHNSNKELSIQDHTVFLKKKNYPLFLQKLFKSKPLEVSTRSENLNLHLEALYYSFKNFGVSNENLQLLKDAAFEISTLSSKESFKELLSLVVSGKRVHQSLFNAFITKLMAENLSWSSQGTMQKLLQASFFSYVGSDMDATLSLLMKAGVSDDILNIVKHSKENQDGSGAYGIKKAYIHPLSKLIRVSDEFYPYFNSKELSVGINYLKSLSPQKLDSQCVGAIIKIFQK